MVVSFVNCRIAANSRPANGVCQDYIAPTLPTEIRPPGTNPRILRIVQAFRRPVRLDAPHDVLRPLVNDDVARLDVQQRLVRMRMLRVLAVAVLVDPGDELLRCWAFQVEEKGVDLHGALTLPEPVRLSLRPLDSSDSPTRPAVLNRVQPNVLAATVAIGARGTDDEFQMVGPTRSTIHGDPFDVQVEGVAEPLDGHRDVAAAQCGRRVVLPPCRPVACVSFGDDAHVSPVMRRCRASNASAHAGLTTARTVTIIAIAARC